MRYLAITLFLTSMVQADDWPQWMGPKRDNVWREAGILDTLPKEGLKPVWKATVAGGYAGPAVADGRVFVPDFVSGVDPKAEVYERKENKGTERLLCFNEQTGELLWKYEYPCTYTISFPNGPRATPCVVDGKVYSLGSEGNLVCLDASKGTLLWSKDFKKDYGAKTPLWGFSGHPFVDGQRLICIVGGEKACVVAFDKDTGKELWKALNAREPGYSTPTIIEAAGVRQLLIWHADSVNSLNPETGEKYWSVLLRSSNGASIMSPMRDGDYLFVGGYDVVCKGLKLKRDTPGAEELWTGNRKTGLYPVNAQPYVADGLVYGVCTNGELRCVEMATGKRLWETLEPVGGKAGQCTTAFMIKHENRFFLFNEKGELIIASINKDGYQERSRSKILDTTGHAFGRDLVYCAPAFANKRIYVRNDRELVCYSLAK